jgi:hypothetical protein
VSRLSVGLVWPERRGSLRAAQNVRARISEVERASQGRPVRAERSEPRSGALYGPAQRSYIERPRGRWWTRGLSGGCHCGVAVEEGYRALPAECLAWSIVDLCCDPHNVLDGVDAEVGALREVVA